MKKILYVTSECSPYAGSSSLAEISYSLSKQINCSDYEVRVILPLYSEINAVYVSKMQYIGSKKVFMSWRSQEVRVYELKANGIIYYFLDIEEYFNRKTMYGHMDDVERFAFFSKAVLDVFSITDYFPDIIHCHDWQTSLVPVFLKTLYLEKEQYADIKTIYTIHHIEHQGKIEFYQLEELLGIPDYSRCILENSGKLNIVKGAIVVSDLVTTVSPNYREELFSSEQAVGLEGTIRQNRDKFFGILLGIDYQEFNPSQDPMIFDNFSMSDLRNRAKCKNKLQEAFGLRTDANIPIIAVITKLVNKKGVDLLKIVLEDLLSLDIQFILLGKGEEQYETYFESLEKRYSTKMRTVIAFNNDVAKKLFSGSDFLLMPSQTEPCGRSQMIASRYGAIPIVRKTGGLADSIIDVRVGGNGYVFEDYSASEMLDTVKRAIDDFKNYENRMHLIDKVMRTDFSWERTAEQYIKRLNILTRE